MGGEAQETWAGKGDGVLFYDADNDGLISDDREYIFTAWGERRKRNGPVDSFRQRTREAQGTAGDDLAALRSRFDTNGDGKLSGAELSGFKVMVTTDNGTLVTKTLAERGITEIGLTQDTTRIQMADGSAITGQAAFAQNGDRTAAKPAELVSRRISNIEAIISLRNWS